MKKFLLLALAAMAVNAQAATIYWGLGADVYLMKAGEDYTSAVIAYDDNAPAVDSSAYLALVYLGQGVDTFEIDNITTDSIVVDKTGAIQTMAYALDTDGATYADFDPPQRDINVLAADYADGASFGVVWYNGKSFDYIYSIDDGSALNTGVTISDMTRGSDYVMPASQTTGYGGVIAVPEPSTAMLALAGLALLLKRRKA